MNLSPATGAVTSRRNLCEGVTVPTLTKTTIPAKFNIEPVMIPIPLLVTTETQTGDYYCNNPDCNQKHLNCHTTSKLDKDIIKAVDDKYDYDNYDYYDYYDPEEGNQNSTKSG